jgi:hypothetical protein
VQLFFLNVCDAIAKQPCTVEACSQGRLLNPGLKEPDCIVKEMLSYYRANVSSAASAAYIPPVNRSSPITAHADAVPAVDVHSKRMDNVSFSKYIVVYFALCLQQAVHMK